MQKQTSCYVKKPMRRKNREITDYTAIYEIMKKCDVCSVAFQNEPYPYIIPMNFGVVLQENNFKLYFHCAKAGMKLDLLRKNPNVAFEMNCSHRLLLAETACDSSMDFESVCGNGVMRILPDDLKMEALTILMNQYQKDQIYEFSIQALNAVEVLELTVNEITGKHKITK